MEHVVVTYPTRRQVRIDGQDSGFTNDTLMVQAGHHVFDLGDPQDYQPPSVARVVQNTNPVAPMVIPDFHPAGGVA